MRKYEKYAQNIIRITTLAVGLTNMGCVKSLLISLY